MFWFGFCTDLLHYAIYSAVGCFGLDSVLICYINVIYSAAGCFGLDSAALKWIEKQGILYLLRTHNIMGATKMQSSQTIITHSGVLRGRMWGSIKACLRLGVRDVHMLVCNFCSAVVKA
jgi:hypothetical protein